METQHKIELLRGLCGKGFLSDTIFYETLERCDALKTDYSAYMTTSPINCERELLRLPNADYDLCCALMTLLLREDHFSNGSFERRQRLGQVQPVIERMIHCLEKKQRHLQAFSEKAIAALNGFYVYALADPRDDRVFYIGKGAGNRVFNHEIESGKHLGSEKQKLKTIRAIEKSGLSVKRIIVNWGLSESEAFAAEAALINLMNFTGALQLTNEVAGHHVHTAMTVEEFEAVHGAVPLKAEDIKHSVLVIKINKLYRRGMSEVELYDTVRGFWAASLKSIEARKVRYVFGVYNGLIVAVYQPDEWHYCREMIDIPQQNLLRPEDRQRFQNRVYFICKDPAALDDEGRFYLNRSIANLRVNQTAQNPITYLLPQEA